jgi:alkylation response protein AidB-like acyl-CoA dehydrogenase
MLPHEETLENTDTLPPELAASLRKRSMELGIHACNLPEKVGGGGLDAVSVMLIEKELGRTSLALAECAHRPLNILAACVDEQVTQVGTSPRFGHGDAIPFFTSKGRFQKLCHLFVHASCKDIERAMCTFGQS